MRAYDLGFRIGPRINAAGRMDAARAVVELFDTTDQEEARRLAEHLDRRNQERKQVQEEIVARAVEELEGGDWRRPTVPCGSDCRRRLASRRDRHRGVEDRRTDQPALRGHFA